MKMSMFFVVMAAFLSLSTLHAQEKRNEFDGEWVGSASSQVATCPRGTYQITVKDSQITGTFNIQVGKASKTRFDTSTVTGQVGPDGKAQVVHSGVDTKGRSSKFSGTFTSTEFRGSDTRGRCDYEVQLQRR
jgi:hypothetical protein